ncbi:hypothetical protein MHY85_10440 [Cellulomonas sp. ACRRI]|nr:hypothetical protein [Cellulomonas sp. ACRRI]MCG7286386.1 hypothetical protein [Cellulomonas sp. ACRRI]
MSCSIGAVGGSYSAPVLAPVSSPRPAAAPAPSPAPVLPSSGVLDVFA